MKKKFLAGLAISMLVAACIGSAEADIIDDSYGAGAGSFELGNFINGGGNPHGAGLGYMGLLPGDTMITGWTVGGPGDGVDWLIDPWFNADAGIHSVDLQHWTNSSISTTISTITGNVYQLSFSAAAATAPLATSAEGMVSAGSLINQTFTTVFSDSYANQTFMPFNYLFTATGPTTTIEFMGNGPTGPGTQCYGPAIDSVSVSPVPVPATVLLFGIGLAGLVGTRLRRKKK